MECQLALIILNVIMIITHCKNLPHGMVRISNINPAHPEIVLDEEVSSMVPISIERVGGCKYGAEIGFKCLERTAKPGLDYKCHYQRLTWKDGVMCFFECGQKVVYISIYNDKKYEEDEEFLFELYSLPDNITLGFDRVLIVIARNDINHGEIRIFPNSVSLVEGMNYKLQIQRINGNIDEARVCYQLQSGTAKIEFDVMPAEGCVKWRHNDNQTHLVNIETILDDLWEGDEIFYVKLLNVEGAIIDSSHSQAIITILQNNLNAPFIASTVPPCLESKKKVLINPITEKQFFIQFKARLPGSDKSTINEAHIIMEHVTETDVSLDVIVLKIEGILMDETTISCNNIPHSYEVALQNDETWTLNCESIINHTTIIDYRTSYTCHFTVDCENFDPSKNSPKWINVNTTLTEKKQRLFCQDVNQTSNKISCQCDFPTHIYDDNDWVISDISFGEKYVSRSVKNEIIEMTKQSLWTDQSSVTFMFTIKGFDTNSNIIDIDESKLNSYWIFYLVTDAFPCKETNWTQWSICDAVPVGIGQSYRSHIAVHGLPGQELQCNQIKQHKQCVVNQEKRIKFSKTEINVKEGDDGETVEVRLYHQLSNIKNKSLMTLNEKQRLKGFDVIIYFEIPRFYQKEIVIDPNFIGWQSDKWDVIEQVKITALDDSNIDSLMQKIIIKVNIYSIDTDYNELVLNPLTVIVEDNDKCKYCGIGNIQPFNPVPPPLFWDFKSILLLIVFLIVLLFILWRGCKWFKSKYGVNNDQYKKLKEDGLITESETETETESASHTDKALNSEINSDDKTDIR